MDQPPSTPTMPQYTRVKYFMDNYGKMGYGDQRAVETFMDCENREIIESLKSEMIGMSKGLFKAENMDKLVGRERVVKFGSYDQWAKYVLLWMAGYRG